MVKCTGLNYNNATGLCFIAVTGTRKNVALEYNQGRKLFYFSNEKHGNRCTCMIHRKFPQYAEYMKTIECTKNEHSWIQTININ